MDPMTGRFLSPDPIEGPLNPYSYVGNNPVNYNDPTGMLGGPVQIWPVLVSHGFNIMGLNENPCNYFDRDHQTRAETAARLADIIEDAQKLAGTLKKATDLPEWERRAWSDLADLLGQMLTEIKDNIAASCRGENVEWNGLIQFAPGNLAPMTESHNKGSDSHLEINADLLNGMIDHGGGGAWLIASLIHEAGHVSYFRNGMDRTPLPMPWANEEGYASELEITAYDRKWDRNSSNVWGYREQALQYSINHYESWNERFINYFNLQGKFNWEPGPWR
jgi:hypothetical protein